jgi:hypothetical protein
MEVRFENRDRQTPANLATQVRLVRTLPHKFDCIYFRTPHVPKGTIYIRSIAAGRTRLSKSQEYSTVSGQRGLLSFVYIQLY